MAGRPKPRGIDRSSPPWMLTYGDMATLLLVFFVFLFAVSEVREEKFKAATGSLRAEIGLRPRQGSVVESRTPVETRRRDRRQKERLGLSGEEDRVVAAAQGERVVVGARVTFARGSAELAPAAADVLRRLADELRGLRNIVEVRGHAESGECAGEVGRKADLELELSLDRAAAALTFLVDDGGLERSRLRAMGAGAEEPPLLGDGPAGARRVEIVVVRELAPPAGDGRP